MKDILQDIVKYTYSLGSINLVKIVGTENDTKIVAQAEDNVVSVKAFAHNPIPDFIGLFGMPNLSKLNTILNTPEYAEDAVINVKASMSPDGVRMLEGIHFENKAGNFSNDYRFMAPTIVSELVKTVSTNIQTWDIEIIPTVNSIQRLKFQAAANNEENFFAVKVEKNNLVFNFGDHSTHSGKFVFHEGITGKLSKTWHWPISAVLSILALPGDKVMCFSDKGMLLIKVDSGLVNYQYLLPALTK
jgi:hypothetical protein